jgi:DNA-binding NtrC family response regulator
MLTGSPKPRILIADSYERANDNLTQQLLARCLDIPAETVWTLRAARAALTTQRFDLMICRNLMPDGSAVEFIPEVWRTFHVPAIITSGSLGEQQLAARIPAEMFCGALSIPYKVERLAKAIDAAIVAFARLRQTCPDCRGTGFVELLVNRVVCSRCSGRG